MPSLFLTTPGTRVSLTSERLHVEFPPANGDTEPPPPRDIPLHDIEQVVADERTCLTTPALCECLRRSIPVVLLAHNQSVIGLCQAPAGSALVRVIQHRRAAEPGLALALAAALVEGKIQNSRRVLQRLATNRAAGDLAQPLTDLEYLRRSCLAPPPSRPSAATRAPLPPAISSATPCSSPPTARSPAARAARRSIHPTPCSPSPTRSSPPKARPSSTPPALIPPSAISTSPTTAGLPSPSISSSHFALRSPMPSPSISWATASSNPANISSGATAAASSTSTAGADSSPPTSAAWNVSSPASNTASAPACAANFAARSRISSAP